ncbi:phosphatase 2C-like domain-containing protein [Crucibulum laeve]|uniref:Protein phosphatase n=1 Tax=Crucibulum laeve TaxID=68775 RepID=A0A5C3MBM0_9AGAR|nr:phosphatase 2C-like domain-containing protein [Crucibulum laeve]
MAWNTLTCAALARNASRRLHHRALSTHPNPRPYTFHIGASWAGKPNEPHQRPKVPWPADGLIGSWRDRTLARPNRTTTSKDAGEDFFFIQEMRNQSILEGVSFGVADGVGGWVDSGVDPSLFSQALMYHSHRYSRNAWAGEPEIDPTLDYEEREQIEGWEMTPYECLDLAYGGVLREKFVQAGSSTACIISLNASSGLLRSANLGDSGFLIIRSSAVHYRQRAQTHFFNCPKQLTKLPANSGRRFSRACIDSPSEADVFETKLRDGDIVIAYTDGLSDNVFPSEMVTICSLVARAGGTEEEQVQAIADRIVEYARQCMKNKNRVSPFERDAARQGMFFRGGKPDDVTVVVAIVHETS